MNAATGATWAAGVAGGERTARERAATAPILIGAMCGAVIAGRLETAAIATGMAAIAAMRSGAGVPRRGWFAVVIGGALLSLALNLYLVSGPALVGPTLFGLHPNSTGLRAGILLALRLAGASIAVHGLRSAWPGERAADEAARVLRPLEWLRVPVGEARTVLGLAMRFAPLIAAEARRVTRLQEMRAGARGRGLGARLELARAAAVPIIVSALERAERVSLALEARHYRVRPASTRRWAPLSSALGALLFALALLWRA